MRFNNYCNKNERPISDMKVPLIGSKLFSTKDNQFYPLYIWCYPVINNLPDEIIYSYPISHTIFSRNYLGTRGKFPINILNNIFLGNVSTYRPIVSAIINHAVYTTKGDNVIVKRAVFYSRFMIYSIDTDGKFEIIMAIASNTISDIIDFSNSNSSLSRNALRRMFLILNQDHLDTFSNTFRRRIKVFYNQIVAEKLFTRVHGNSKLMFENPLTLSTDIKTVFDLDSIKSKAIGTLDSIASLK